MPTTSQAVTIKHRPRRNPAINKHYPAILLVLLLSACISVPPEPLLIDRAQSHVTDPGVCTAIGFPDRAGKANEQGLRPDGFALLSWNLHRGSEAGLEQTLHRLAAGRALLTLQEAQLDDDLRHTLDALGLDWNFSPGFILNGRAVGVLTAASTPALARCVRRSNEPWLQIPKLALYTVYPLAGTASTLLVVNLHGINFSIATTEFAQQLQQARHVVAEHRGPMIVAGDFNTWSEQRTALLHKLTAELALQEVKFANEHRTHVWGLPLDHIYYRGLQVLEATSTEQAESDHNPLLVTFAIPQHPQEATP